ncbi:DUF427 domain-containing protein [Wenxinia marina]|uniref:Wenxma_15, whole genome shotgun sequence n=1 Tax=Wenxinia marina DSM 24838 TaxID=1123501 RepID=A0A0D0NIV7_9RHOB|nr:DUF427 domain-containing protein [Wenxinia marina]KIQ68240.1 hypothetical protein Wenmar_03250 [Wenxinia marina DSM 24838]GGL76991.1 hypothetical protein GCM10011392_34350 [Wenxinia marina]
MTDLPPENVQDYPRPPRLEPVPHRLVVRLGGETVAETDRAPRVLETHHPPTYYVPRADVRARLDPAAGGSVCEWKGVARYFDVTSGGVTARRAAWSYESPSARFADLAGHLAFYPGLMEACFVGDMPVLPQDGDFYGGWVTANLTGRPKGAQGTEHW